MNKIAEPSSEVKQKILQHFKKYALPKRVFESKKAQSTHVAKEEL